MKIEMDDNAGLVTVLCVIIISLALCAIGGCRITEETKREAIKNGLVQKQSAGQTTHWAKP
jgi:hypothetical protein